MTTGVEPIFDLLADTARAIHEVDDSPGVGSITVQTIHAAKGLEHPIVILANVNQYSFPPSGGGADRIRYEDLVGLRQSKQYAKSHGKPHVYDNWRHRILSKCLSRDYDEERRLMYVAITRAESHLLFTAGASPSPLFENLPLEPTEIDPEVEAAGEQTTEQARLQVSVPVPDTPDGQSSHSLMDDRVFSDVEEGKGVDFGTRVHEFAEQYVKGEHVEPSNPDEEHIRDLIDSLPGDLIAEENTYLPVAVGDDRVTISGIIDLLHVTEERVDIIDYKTDRTRHAESEYCKQPSVYYHLVRGVYPERPVTAILFYTADGERVEVDPLSRREIADLFDRNGTNSQLNDEENAIIR